MDAEGNEQRCLLRFNLERLQHYNVTEVLAAELVLTSTTGTGLAYWPLMLQRLQQRWDEALVTWTLADTSRWVIPGGTASLQFLATALEPNNQPAGIQVIFPIDTVRMLVSHAGDNKPQNPQRTGLYYSQTRMPSSTLYFSDSVSCLTAQQSLLDGSTANYGFLISASSMGPGMTLGFGSREAASDLRPVLHLELMVASDATSPATSTVPYSSSSVTTTYDDENPYIPSTMALSTQEPETTIWETTAELLPSTVDPGCCGRLQATFDDGKFWLGKVCAQTYTLPCPTGSEGTVSRVCGAQATWAGEENVSLCENTQLRERALQLLALNPLTAASLQAFLQYAHDLCMLDRDF